MPNLGIFLLLITTSVFSLLTAVAGEPRGEFWIVRAGNETADPLVGAIEGKKLAPDTLASRITALIEEGKIEQLARFNQTLEKQRILCKRLTGEMLSPAGEKKLELGVFLDAEVALSRVPQPGESRFHLEIRNKKANDEYFSKLIATNQNLLGDHWELVGIWKNAEESTLFLGRLADYPGGARTEPAYPRVALQIELMEISPKDVAQFGKSTPATRQKAAVWLRGRSKLLAASVVKLNPGVGVRYRDEVCSLASKKTSMGAGGGFTLEAEHIASRDGKKVDVTLLAKWQDPEKPADWEGYQFTVRETLDAGQSRLFEPAIAPRVNGAATMLLVTPVVCLPKDYAQMTEAPRDPSSVPDKISTFEYPVAAEFNRVMRNSPGANRPLLVHETLEQSGLNFPPGTMATFSAANCSVLLTHNREGHLKFMILLKARNLLP